jgi:N-acetylmuramoyl-L-alanine amidase
MKILLPALMTILIIVTPLSSVSAANDYVVKKGDTLWGISQDNKLSVQEIVSWNKLKGTTIAIGQKLQLSNQSIAGPIKSSATTDVFHTVAKGETLYAISLKYKVSVQSLMTWNQMKTTILVIGQKIKVGSTSVTAPAPTPVASAVIAQTTTNLYLRETASATGKPLVIMPKGSTVKVLNKISQWWKIDYKGKIGYSSSTYLKVTGTTTTPVPVPTPAPIVEIKAKTNTNLYFRETATTTGKVISIMSQGTIVKVLNKTSTWWKIELNGKTGYASGQYLTVLSGTIVTPVTPVTPVIKNGKIVVLDPGHGGSDPGAVNGGVNEGSINLAHSLRAKAHLERLGYTVYITRSTNVSCITAQGLGSGIAPELDCRVKFATKKDGDIFVSVHANATIPGIRGTETYFNNNTSWNGKMNLFPVESGKLASAIHAKYAPVFGSRDRGVRSANYYVNNNATMPSVLLEVGYVTDLSDLSKLTNSTKQDQIGKAIAEGINVYFQK